MERMKWHDLGGLCYDDGATKTRQDKGEGRGERKHGNDDEVWYQCMVTTGMPTMSTVNLIRLSRYLPKVCG